MGLFDELRRQVEEAVAEATGERRRPAASSSPASPPVPPQPQAPSATPPAPEQKHRQRRARPAAMVRRQQAQPEPIGLTLRRSLSKRQNLRQAVLLHEILGPPKALRRR